MISYKKDEIKKDLKKLEKSGVINIIDIVNIVDDVNILQLNYIIDIMILKKYINKEYKRVSTFVKNERVDFRIIKKILTDINIKYYGLVNNIDLDYRISDLKELKILKRV